MHTCTSASNRAYSLKHTGCKWQIPINPRQGSPYASAVITAIRYEATSLNYVKIESCQHASFMGVKGGVIKQIKGTETLFKVLSNINFLLRQDANNAANSFDQTIKRAHRKNMKYLNSLLDENHKLHFVRVFLPVVGEPNEDEQLMSERLKPKLGKFSNRWRRKRTVFGGCVGYRRGEIFKWGDLVGSEFIFFFKGDQLGFNFYAKQQEILSYWYDYLNLGLEKHYLKYLWQPYYAGHFNVRTVLDQRNMPGVLDFVVKNVLPVKLAHMFIKDDLALRETSEEALDAEQHAGGSDELQQTA